MCSQLLKGLMRDHFHTSESRGFAFGKFQAIQPKADATVDDGSSGAALSCTRMSGWDALSDGNRSLALEKFRMVT